MHLDWTDDPSYPPTSTNLDSQYFSGYGVINDTDYYKFTMPANNGCTDVTAIVTDVNGSDATFNVRISVYIDPSGSQSSGTAYESANTATATVSGPIDYLYAGTYYIIVGSDQYNGERYDMEVQFVDDGGGM